MTAYVIHSGLFSLEVRSNPLNFVIVFPTPFISLLDLMARLRDIDRPVFEAVFVIRFPADVSLVSISDHSLMNVLLAYSAFHRASILNHELPAKRIVSYFQSVPQDLRDGTCKPQREALPATLGVLLLLTSMSRSPSRLDALQIASRQAHLKEAKHLIVLNYVQLKDDNFEAFNFLIRWCLQLESMNGPNDTISDKPLLSDLDDRLSCLSTDCLGRNSSSETHIDCLWGMSFRCLSSMSQVSHLAGAIKLHPYQHIDSESKIRAIRMEAFSLELKLKYALEKNNFHAFRCDSVGDGWARRETVAITKAYHWAAVIHLKRQVQRVPSSHPDVQGPVKKILELLECFKTSKDMLLFPIVTAGVEAQSPEDRKLIIQQLKKLEVNGLPSVRSLNLQSLCASSLIRYLLRCATLIDS